jgi:hypothetical protein
LRQLFTTCLRQREKGRENLSDHQNKCADAIDFNEQNNEQSQADAIYGFSGA